MSKKSGLKKSRTNRVKSSIKIAWSCIDAQSEQLSLGNFELQDRILIIMDELIKCPNCGFEFDVEEAITGKVEAHIRKEYELKMARQAELFHQEKTKLELRERELQNQEKDLESVIQEKLKAALDLEKTNIEEQTKKALGQELELLRKENAQRNSELTEFKKKELEVLQREHDLKQAQEQLNLDMQKKLLEQQNEIEQRARQKERESFELEKRQLLKQIEDNKNLAEEMKRKAEQGSMQLQGEVQELALEETLRNTYPFDRIEEVPKGVRGADCIQRVVNSKQQECGSIVYESKRTKAFGGDWIDKLKQDQLTCKADIAILVTETMPSDMDRFGERNGVWICGFHEVRSVSFVLREMLLRLYGVQAAQHNRGDKKELLYSFFTSNEFAQLFRRVIENFEAMELQLSRERKAMNKLWAEREKQIWGVHENLTALFGSIKGIAGQELDGNGLLELPGMAADDE